MKTHYKKEVVEELRPAFWEPRPWDAGAMNADDSKEVILACLQEEIDYWEGRVEAMREEQENENRPWWQHGLDPAFRCWKDVYAMFI